MEKETMFSTQALQRYFDADALDELATSADFDPLPSVAVLSQIVTRQAEAIVLHVRTETGHEQFQEVSGTLPHFGSIPTVLATKNEAAKLWKAGELLLPHFAATVGFPALMESSFQDLQQEGSQVGRAQVYSLLYMICPLLLSWLNRQDLTQFTAQA